MPDCAPNVDAARKEWTRRLVDLSRRNSLLYFRDLKVGSLDLSDAPRDALQALLHSDRTPDDAVPLGDLFEHGDLTGAAASLKEIWARARSNFEEKGLATLFLAVALAEWKAADDGRDTSAPVMLVPIEATPPGGKGTRWLLRRSGEIQINDVLVHALEVEHKVTVIAEDLLQLILGDDEDETLDLSPVLNRLKQIARNVPGFDIKERWVLGNFAFQKMAIVKDLRELADAMNRHNIVAGIAGCEEARMAARGGGTGGDPIEMDRLHPDNEFLILDADSSQQQAISISLKGQNGVISGPPGTGKSQTIANLIAEMVSRGKTVLFVAEKRAALDVVKQRLDDVGLSHLCLDCHGAETSRRTIAEQLQKSLSLIREATQPDATQLHAKFIDKRDRLNRHVACMHSLRLATGLSLYQMYGQWLLLPAEVQSDVRLDRASVQRIKRDQVEEACELLRESGAHAELVTGTATAPWMGAVFNGQDGVRGAVETARSLAGKRWAACESALGAFVAEISGKAPVTVGDVGRCVDVLKRIDEFRLSCSEELFARSLDELCRTLAPARGKLSTLWAVISNSAFRAAVKDVRQLGQGRRLSAREALTTAESTAALLNEWRAATSSSLLPRWSSRFDALTSAWSDVSAPLGTLVAVFPARKLDQLQIAVVGAWLRDLSTDGVTPAQLLRLQEIDVELSAFGFAPVLTDIRARKPPAEQWPGLLRSAWLSSSIEEVQLADPTVPTFSGRRHDEIAREFRKLDEERLQLAVHRVRRAHAEAAVDARNKFPDQNGLVSKEAGKKARHLPLRQLFARAPNVLLGLRPCWMASPLSVSQLIPGDRPHFDVVVFDEASQVLPEDAVTSLLRGRQAVVAGDRRQLPPTTFFAAGEGESQAAEEGEGATTGFESILDVMSAFLDPPLSLDWHYRSRDEALIAYSNHRIYGGRLVTFPGPGLRQAVRHVLVDGLPGQAGQEESSSPEVRRVVELVLEHAATRPTETLGVIAMGIAHAKRIEMEFDRARQGRPELDEFFATNRSERFFIKNLERVQGDERDAIILSVGYGKNETGRLVYRFGPLNWDGGERRLNVAITRARRRMTVVSSFSHLDVDPNNRHEGVKHLRNYLEYAATGGKSLGFASVNEVPLNDFEQAVCDELTRRGLKLVGQVGTSNYRIDLVAMHPEKPGRRVLAIECDGASYHSATSARDRDRLRQQQLEAIGWRFCRIWSTDWFLRREEEVKRVLDAYERALRQVEREDARGDAPAPPEAPLPAGSTPSFTTPGAARRGPRPFVIGGPSIDDYPMAGLVAIVRWVKSDGRLWTDDEILTKVMDELGFSRKGAKIVERITAAIRAS